MKRSQCRRRALVALFVLASGCERPVSIILQANPNPFPGHRGFALVPVAFDGLHVNDVPAGVWMAGRSQQQQGSFNTDLGAVGARFAESVIEHCGAARGIEIAQPGMARGGFVIRPTLARVDTGGDANADNRLIVRIYDVRGAQMEVVIFHSMGACPYNYALGTRMRCAAASFGSQLCDYLSSRSGG